jgi:hypothetical protein
MTYVCLCDIGDLSLHLAVYAAVSGAVALFVLAVVVLVTGTTEANIESDLRDCRRLVGAKKE